MNAGTVELLDGSQRIINWLWNSHIENTRRMINNQLVIAPSLVVMADILNPGPAFNVRLSPEGERMLMEGQLSSAGAAVSQLNISDVTRGHLATADAVFGQAQRMAGSSDTAEGQPLESKRTLGEIQSILASSNQRLSIKARLIDTNAIAPLANRAISNRLQFTSEEQFFRIVGTPMDQEAMENLGRVRISKADIQGAFDYVPHSSIMPADPSKQSEIWIQILNIASSNPMLMAPGPDGKILNIQRIFKEVVSTSGIKHFDEFYYPAPPPMVMPDEQVQAGVQAGNMVPAGPIQ